MIDKSLPCSNFQTKTDAQDANPDTPNWWRQTMEGISDLRFWVRVCPLSDIWKPKCLGKCSTSANQDHVHRPVRGVAGEGLVTVPIIIVVIVIIVIVLFKDCSHLQSLFRTACGLLHDYKCVTLLPPRKSPRASSKRVSRTGSRSFRSEATTCQGVQM